MRRLYIDGRYSVKKNLPIPSLHSLDRMTFINFGDTITDFFTICKHDRTEFNPREIKKITGDEFITHTEPHEKV